VRRRGHHETVPDLPLVKAGLRRSSLLTSKYFKYFTLVFCVGVLKETNKIGAEHDNKKQHFGCCYGFCLICFVLIFL
jgi:hypothetical protein